MKKRIIIGMSGASGAPITEQVLRMLQLRKSEVETHLVITESAALTLEQECHITQEELASMADTCYDIHAMGARIASGSFQTDGMLIVPCSMKTVAGIVSGYSDNLLLRAADVVLKEHRKLVLVAREAPLSTIHLRNLYEASKFGAVIFPPVLSCYQGFQTVEELSKEMAKRILGQFGLDMEAYQWTGMEN